MKLVAVLWVSTPLSPQRAASKPIHVKEPVLRTGQDHLPAYQAIWIKMYERGGFAPPPPRTNSWIETRRSYLHCQQAETHGNRFRTRSLSSLATDSKSARLLIPLPLKVSAG